MSARATGIGSWPGTQAREAIRTVRDLLAEDLPFLPELPARGPGADLIGRTASMLVDLPVDLQPSGWRLTDARGADSRRGAAFLREDLDELAEAYDGYTGAVKLQLAGPWTLAAGIQLPRGEAALSDPGACRDIAESLSEAVRAHVAQVRRLVPGVGVSVQLDEPSLPAVLSGALPTASGYGRVRAVEPGVASAAVHQVLEAARAAVGPSSVAATVVHCCAAPAPLEVLRRTGADALAVDVTRLAPAQWEQLAAAHESGVATWWGVLPTSGALSTPSAVLEQLVRGAERAGLEAGAFTNAVLTPACGLAGSPVAEAVATLRRARECAAEVSERFG
ncbi:methionine synthase [Dermacoccaceae bacterium W4C1]